MNFVTSQVQEKLSKLPDEIKEKVVAALEAAAIEGQQLHTILPVLNRSLQVARKDDGAYTVAIIDCNDGKLLLDPNDNDKPLSIDSFVKNFNFEGGSQYPGGAITFDDLRDLESMTEEEMQAISSGKKTLKFASEPSPSEKAIPASDARSLSKNMDKIGRGEIQVDTSK